MSEPWTPDQPLRHDATNGQIGARLIHVNGGNPIPLEMIGVVSEYMSACTQDLCDNFNALSSVPPPTAEPEPAGWQLMCGNTPVHNTFPTEEAAKAAIYDLNTSHLTKGSKWSCRPFYAHPLPPSGEPSAPRHWKDDPKVEQAIAEYQAVLAPLIGILKPDGALDQIAAAMTGDALGAPFEAMLNAVAASGGPAHAD